MKDEAQQPWEAEVRRVVETHEFDYDPAAWAGMEQLLDSTPTAAGGNAGSWWASAWKWLLPAGLILAGGMWWMVSRPAPHSLQGSLPVSTDTEELLESPVFEVEETKERIAPTRIPEFLFLPAKPFTVQSNLPMEATMPPIRRVTPPTVAPIPSRVPVPLPVPDEQADTTLEVDFERKRNRKALFPDVIKKY
jgi:hypothetical protein